MKELLVFGMLCSLAGNSLTERSPLIGKAVFLSTNFENIFTWESGEESPLGTLYYVQYKKYGEAWQEKKECQNVTRHFCNLTCETEKFSEQFYARVRAFIPKCCPSDWVLSSRFWPREDTNIGSPEVKFIPSVQSIKFIIQPPYTPLRDEDNQTLTVADIFGQLGTEVQYQITMFSQKTQQKWVKTVSNKEFDITDLDANTEYNGTIHIKVSDKISKPYVFRVKTLPDHTWMPYLFVVILFMMVLIFGTIYYLIDRYMKQYTSEQPTALDFKSVSRFQPLVPKAEHFLIPYNLSKPAQHVPEAQLMTQVGPHLLGALEEHQKLFSLAQTAYQQQVELPSFERITQPGVLEDRSPVAYAPQVVKHNPPCTADTNPSNLTYGLCIQSTGCVNKPNSPPKQTMEPDSCVENTINNGLYQAQNPEQIKCGWWVNKANEVLASVLENAEHRENNRESTPPQPPTLLDERVPSTASERTGSYRRQPTELLQAAPEIRKYISSEADPLLSSQLFVQGAHNDLCRDHGTKQRLEWDSLAWTAGQWPSFRFQTTDCIDQASKGLETDPESLGSTVPNPLDSAPNSGLFTGLFRDLELKIQWDQGPDENAAIY